MTDFKSYSEQLAASALPEIFVVTLVPLHDSGFSFSIGLGGRVLPAGTIGRALRRTDASAAYTVYFEDFKPPSKWNRDYWVFGDVTVKQISPLEVLAREAL